MFFFKNNMERGLFFFVQYYWTRLVRSLVLQNYWLYGQYISVINDSDNRKGMEIPDFFLTSSGSGVLNSCFEILARMGVCMKCEILKFKLYSKL